MRELTATFKSHDGLKLFRRVWLPDGNPRAVIVFIHGAFEHSGRYDYAWCQMASRGLAVHSFDLRGHGRSEGEITPQTSFADMIIDIDRLLQLVRDENPGLPLFLAGQSLGGALAIMYCCEKGCSGLRGLVLCAPALKLRLHPLSVLAGYALGKLLPHYAVSGVSARFMSRDMAVVHAYEHDPLVDKQGIPVKLLSDFAKIMVEAQKKFCGLDVPFLIMHGTQDHVADIKGSRALYERVASRDKTMKELPGVFHDILNDTGREKVYEQMVSWIEERRK